MTDKVEVVEKVDKILVEIDRLTLLGAAYDTMSEKSKAKFRLKLLEIVNEE